MAWPGPRDREPPAGPGRLRLDTSNPRFRSANSAARARSPPTGPSNGPSSSSWRPNGPTFASAYERRPPSPPPRAGPPTGGYYSPREPAPRSDGRWPAYGPPSSSAGPSTPAGPSSGSHRPGPPPAYPRSPPSAGRKRMRDDFDPPRDRMPPSEPRQREGSSSSLGAAPTSLPPVPHRQRQQLRPSMLPPRDEPNGAYAARSHSRGPSYESGPPSGPMRDSYGRSYPSLDSPPSRSPTMANFAPRSPPNGRLPPAPASLPPAPYPSAPRGPLNGHGYAPGPRLGQSPHPSHAPRGGPQPPRAPAYRPSHQPPSPYERTWRPETGSTSAPLADRDRQWERADWSGPDKRRRTDTYDGRREREQSWSTARGSDRAPSPPEGLGIRRPPSRVERASIPPDQQPFDPGTDRRPRSPSPLPAPPTKPMAERLASPFHGDENETPAERLRTASGGFGAHREARAIASNAGSPHLNGCIASPPKSAQPLAPAPSAPAVVDDAATDDQSVAKALVRALDRIVTDGDATVESVNLADVSVGPADTTMDELPDESVEVEVTWRDLLGEIMDGGNYGRSVVDMDPVPLRRTDVEPPKAISQKLDIFAELEPAPLLEAHDVLRPYLEHDMQARVLARSDRVDELKETYRTLNDRWQVHCTEMAKGRERRERPAPTSMASGGGSSLLHLGAPSTSTRGQTAAPVAESPISMTGLGRSRRLTAGGGGVGTGIAGDAVRSEAEFLAILASLESADMQDPTMRARRTAAVVPDQLDAHEAERYLMRFDDANGRIDDPEAFFGITARMPVDAAWTDDEVELFCRKYGTHPKAFGRIALAIEGKTVQQCVRFYYDTKHIINYRKLVRHRGVVPGGHGTALPGLLRRKVAKTSAPKAAKAAPAPNADEAAYDGGADVTMADRELSPAVSLRGSTTQLPAVPPVPNGIHSAPDSALVSPSIETAGAATTAKRRKGTSYWGVAEKNEFARLYAEHGRDFEQIAKGLGNKTPAQCRNYLQRLEAKNSAAREDSEASETPLPTPSAQATIGRTGPVFGFFDGRDRDPPTRPSLMSNGLVRRGSGMALAAMLNDASDGEDVPSGRSDARGHANSIRPVVRDWFEETDDEADSVSNAPASTAPAPQQPPSQPKQYHDPRWAYPSQGGPPPGPRAYTDPYARYADPYPPPPSHAYPPDLTRYASRPPPSSATSSSAAAAPDAYGRPPPNEAYARSPYSLGPSWDFPPLSATARAPPSYPNGGGATSAYAWHHQPPSSHDRRPSWPQQQPGGAYYGAPPPQGPARSAPPPPPPQPSAYRGGAYGHPPPGSAPPSYERR